MGLDQNNETFRLNAGKNLPTTTTSLRFVEFLTYKEVKPSPCFSTSAPLPFERLLLHFIYFD